MSASITRSGDILGLAAIAPAPLGVAEVRSPGIDEVPMNPQDALYALLLSLFSADELRRWIAYDDRRGVIVDELPGAIASKSALVTAAIEALAQHGLVDAALLRE